MTNLRAPKHKELKPEDLKWKCNPDELGFESTSNVKPIDGIVGQERAVKALKLGVDLRSPGYNIFLTGLSGTGKATTVKKMLQELSPDSQALNDYAYVNNFNDSDKPMLLVFSAGKAKTFKNDLASSIKFLQENIPQVLENENFVLQKKQLISHYNDQQQNIKNTFEEKLRKDNFTLGQVKVGEVPRPEIFALIEDKPVFIGQLDELVLAKKITKQKAKQITKKYTDFQDELQSVFKQSMQLSQEFQEKIISLEINSVKDIIEATLTELKSKYQSKKVTGYLDQVAQSILDNLDIFKGQRPSTEESGEGYIIDYMKDYEVNIILDNSNKKESPVVIETTPNYSNLFGMIEKYSDGRGGWLADFTRIKSGSLLKANGGYLVINAADAFNEPGVWKTLKRVLMYGKLEIQDMANVYHFSPSILKPEAINVDTKILLIGSNYIYSVLSGYEEDFKKIFKVKAEFDYEMKRTDKSIVEYSKIIKKLIDAESLLEFSSGAIAAIIEYGSRYAGEKNKLTARFSYIADLVRESCFWARDVGEELVTEYSVHHAYNAARERHGLYESKVNEMIKEGSMLIDTDGARVGQINGLAVYGNGHYSFGKPTRITATVSLGTGNIINVEREAGLSGSSHNKGVLVITGYFRENFGRKIPLSFQASLVFEQGYGKIDGDSASITEVCALLSCISNIPIKQSLAITGSVNQKGDIQPIGGVNEKVEGFYEICKARGLTKKQGVIIPKQNVKDLMLKDEIVEAVKNKEFHIYSVSKVEEAVEILTGVRAGKLLTTGWHQTNTVFGAVEKTLREMRAKMKPVMNKTPSAPPKKKSVKTKKKK
ncbi:MAG: AAA family ATPase [Ignavibacteriae bacterium]|nr:ATP-binding protein [Ignavibacteriota bacterium]NOG98422.1 AAA family ATPase [Ignavibacteriota bacterium]